MDTVSVPCVEPPSASVAVTRQRMLSPGSTTDGDKVRVSVVAEEIFVGVPGSLLGPPVSTSVVLVVTLVSGPARR